MARLNTNPETLLGYDRDRFSSTVDDEFVCAICLGILRRPVQLPCEHMFCELCIKRWCADNPACPNCRRQVRNELADCHPPSRALLSLLNKLSIHCKFVKEGCSDLLNLTNIEQHELKCDFRPVACPLIGCNKIVPKNAIARHITECERRSKVCEICELSVRNGEIHTKDDCIIALKRALRDCVDVIVQRNSTVPTQMPLAQPPPPLQQPNNPIVYQVENEFEIYFPPEPINVADLDDHSDIETINDPGDYDDDDSLSSWHQNDPDAPAEIDLTAEDAEEAFGGRSPQSAENDDNTLHDEEEEGGGNSSDNNGNSEVDSAESLIGTHSDISWHSTGPVNDSEANTNSPSASNVNFEADELVYPEDEYNADPGNAPQYRRESSDDDDDYDDTGHSSKRPRFLYASPDS